MLADRDAAVWGNPLLPAWEYVPDGEPHVFGERLYLAGSHDRFDGTDFCQDDYVIWSAPLDDLSAWKAHGVSYRRTQDPFNANGSAALYAPDIAQGPDGRYYLYYCLADHPRIGVAVAKEPAGPYEFLAHVRDRDGDLVGTRAGDTEPFDPGVLVDHNRVWLYSGSGPHPGIPGSMRRRLGAVVMELESDMITIRSEPRPVLPTLHDAQGTSFEGHEFFEASSPRRFGDDYYLVYSSVHGHELCWARSRRPDGPFHYGGVLISNADMRVGETATPQVYAGNNHGGLVELSGRYAVFYHRHTNRTQYSRQACAEPIERDTDGRWLQARLSSSGLRFDTLPGEGVFPASMACHLRAATGATWSEPGLQDEHHPAVTQEHDGDAPPVSFIGNMRDGAAAGFRSFSLKGATSVTMTVRGTARGAMQVGLSPDGPPLATASISPSTDWRAAETAINVEGMTPLYLRFEGKGSLDLRDVRLIPIPPRTA